MFEELSLHILDIAMNSLAANASKIEISVLENHQRDWLILRVRDNGRGMDAAALPAKAPASPPRCASATLIGRRLAT